MNRYEPALFRGPAEEGSLPGRALLPILRHLIDQGMAFRFRATGVSMSPFIRSGDVITVSPLGDALPGLGEVVAFVEKETNRLVVHRVAKRRGSLVFTKGDHNLQADGAVARPDILGRVTKVERKGRKVSLGLGPERYAIALLNRKSFLLPWLVPVWRLFRPILTRIKIFVTM